MADGIFVKVEGVPELEALLAKFAGPVAERAMIDGVTKGAQMFQEAITDAAPVRPDLPSGTALPPGKLKSEIQIRLAKLRNGTIATFIEPSKAVRHAARWVEYGHRLVSGGRLTKRGGGKIKGIVVPHPFVRPAFEATESAALDTVEQTIIDDLKIEASQVAAMDDLIEEEEEEEGLS